MSQLRCTSFQIPVKLYCHFKQEAYRRNQSVRDAITEAIEGYLGRPSEPQLQPEEPKAENPKPWQNFRLSLAQCVAIKQKLKGLTLKEVAEQAGVTHTTVHSLITGKVKRPQARVNDALETWLGKD